MRILMIHNGPCDPDSGAAGTAYYIAEGLKEYGHEVVNIWEDGLSRYYKHGNLHYLLELPRAYLNAVKREVENGKRFDVIQMTQPPCYLAAKYIRNYLPKTVVTMQSNGLELRLEKTLKPFIDKEGVDKRSLLRKLFSKILGYLLARQSHLAFKYCSGITVSSSLDEQYMIKELGVLPEKIGLIPQGVSDTFIKRPVKSYTEERHKRLLFVGQLVFYKAPHILVRALNDVLKKRPEISVMWVSHQRFHDDVKGLLIKEQVDPDVQDRIHILPFQEDIVGMYDENGIFLFPSLSEGFGKVFLEAMARGLCVVASDCGGMRDIIINGENGLLVQPGNREELADQLLCITDNFSLAGNISGRAAETARKYTWLKYAEVLTDFYKRLSGLPT